MSSQQAQIIPYPSSTPSTLTSAAASLAEIKSQVNLIQQVMREVMKDGEHYGTVPGCGEKKVLLKSGSEKLMLTFRLSNDLEVETVEMPNFHREFRVKATIYAPTGQRLGTGVGSCSTMESKYRFRSGPVENTGKLVPKEFWDNRESNPGKAQEILGGKGFNYKKIGTKYYIVKQGERVEYDNPADHYNTVLKMAKKRALVDAVLTSTAASDIFTQDLEEDDLQEGAGAGETFRGSPASSETSSVRSGAEQQHEQHHDGSHEQEGNVQKASHDELVAYLNGKNVKHEIEEDGTIHAFPEFSDSAARTWLKDQGFKWDAKNKRWSL